jgi:hypothetical protein
MVKERVIKYGTYAHARARYNMILSSYAIR